MQISMTLQNKKTAILGILATLIIGVTNNAFAKTPSFLGVSLGYYNVLEGHSEAVDLRIKYKHDRSVVFKNLRPWAELNLTSQGNTWLGTGLEYTINVSDNVFISPSFGAGLYKHAKGDLDLGYPLQFKSQLELGYIFKNRSRLSLAFSHLSNAGLNERNPGVEILSLYYYIPLDMFYSNI